MLRSPTKHSSWSPSRTLFVARQINCRGTCAVNKADLPGPWVLKVIYTTTRQGYVLPKTTFDFNDKTNPKGITVKDLTKIPSDYNTYVTEHGMVDVSLISAGGQGDVYEPYTRIGISYLLLM